MFICNAAAVLPVCQKSFSARLNSRDTYRTNRCDVWPNDAVQWMYGVVIVAEPLLGLVLIVHLLLARVTLRRDKIRIKCCRRNK